jgi:hypothetical protein
MNAQKNLSPGIVYIPWPGDEKLINESVEHYRKMDDPEIKRAILRKRELGFIGSRGFAITMLAFHRVLTERYGDSPIAFEHNCFLRWKENEPERFINEHLKEDDHES